MTNSYALRFVAKGTSIVLHPILFTFYLFIILSGFEYHIASKIAPFRLYFALYLLMSTVFIPSALIYMFKHLKLISDFQLSNRKERTFPFLCTAILYYFTARIVIKQGLPIEYYLIIIGATALIVIALFINLRWKISVHMMGIGGVIGIFHGMAAYFPNIFFAPLVISIALAGILGSSRLLLGSHKPAEIYSGFIIGYFLFLILFVAVL